MVNGEKVMEIFNYQKEKVLCKAPSSKSNNNYLEKLKLYSALGKDHFDSDHNNLEVIEEIQNV